MLVWLRCSRRNVEPSRIGWRSMTITGRGPLVDSLNPPKCFDCSFLLRLLQAFWDHRNNFDIAIFQHSHHLQRNDYQYDRPYTAVRDGDFLQAGWPEQCSRIYLVCEWETSDHAIVDSTVQEVYQRYQSVKSRSYHSVDCLMQAMTISFMCWPVQVLNEREKELIDLKCRAFRIDLCFENFG